MSAQLDFLFAMHERLRAKIAGEVAALDSRCERLRGELAECEQERAALDRKLLALLETEAMYRADLAPDAGDGELVATPQLSASGGQIRARVGPKRYLMLAVLRTMAAPMIAEDVADKTGIELRRVRAQLNSDVDNGVVEIEGGAYRLTATGADLLARNESYKNSRGEPLPKRESAAADSDTSDAEISGYDNEDGLTDFRE